MELHDIRYLGSFWDASKKQIFLVACFHEGPNLNPGIVKRPDYFSILSSMPAQALNSSFCINEEKVQETKIKQHTGTVVLQILGMIYPAVVKPLFFHRTTLV